MSFMIYGITGYTGKLTARTALEQGYKPLVAGRNRDAVESEARALGLDCVTFDLDDEVAAVAALKRVKAVFNAAGPYSATAGKMVQRCLEAGAHYLDVTAENDVFKELQDLDDAAQRAGIMLLPGIGAGGGPTDCLAAHLKERMPDATSLNFFGGSLEVVSRGTAKSAMEAIHRPTEVRRGGKLVPLEGELRASIEVDGNKLACVTVPLCDVMVAYWSTRIPNITTYVEDSGAVKQMGSVPGWARRLLGTTPGQRFARWWLDRGVEGPTDEERAAGSYRNVAIAENERGERATTIARGPEGYTFTAISALEATRRAATGQAKPGYQTASTAYGAEFFGELPGCRFEDVN